MADQWADDVRPSDIEDRFTCTACGKRGADTFGRILTGTGAACRRDGLSVKDLDAELRPFPTGLPGETNCDAVHQLIWGGTF
jgi:hypothetical protein